MREELLASLACPLCREQTLRLSQAHAARGEIEAGEIACRRCSTRFPITDSIPVMIPPALRAEGADEEAGLRHKRQQMAFYDAHGASEFEVCRPAGCGRVYEYLLREKFRRAVTRLGFELRGHSVLNVCAGSGMDAQFLTEAGARVIALDLSLQALRAARRRARRFQLHYDLVAADAEALPFAGRTLDVSYVHDGLHHLEPPEVALREMARVARCAVVITEPAAAVLTRVAMCLGIAGEVEEAGNRVNRLSDLRVRQVLLESGACEVRSARYLMFYRHQPLRAFQWFERRLAFAAFRTAFGASNALIGRWGNKLTACAILGEAERNGRPSWAMGLKASEAEPGALAARG